MMPPRLTVIGDLERRDHYFLPNEARCYSWGEYTPYEHTNGLKWDFSPTNHLITNFKKKMDRQGRADWHYKRDAIETVARAFSQFWRWDDLHAQNRVALIPIPPSKPRTDPMFDPRMAETLATVANLVGLPLDIRDCLSFSGTFSASHASDVRPTPVDLYNDLAFDPSVGRPGEPPGVIFLFDDMLTTGAHYVAATQKLAVYFPSVPFVGNFIARRCVPDPFEDFERA